MFNWKSEKILNKNNKFWWLTNKQFNEKFSRNFDFKSDSAFKNFRDSNDQTKVYGEVKIREENSLIS